MWGDPEARKIPKVDTFIERGGGGRGEPKVRAWSWKLKLENAHKKLKG